MTKQFNKKSSISEIASNKKLISRSLLIIEKLVSFLMTAFMANRLSYSDIGYWSQVLFSGSLFTSIISFNIPNGIIAIVPRIKKLDEKYEFIFKSALFVITSGLIFCLFLMYADGGAHFLVFRVGSTATQKSVPPPRVYPPTRGRGPTYPRR